MRVVETTMSPHCTQEVGRPVPSVRMCHSASAFGLPPPPICKPQASAREIEPQAVSLLDRGPWIRLVATCLWTSAKPPRAESASVSRVRAVGSSRLEVHPPKMLRSTACRCLASVPILTRTRAENPPSAGSASHDAIGEWQRFQTLQCVPVLDPVRRVLAASAAARRALEAFTSGGHDYLSIVIACDLCMYNCGR